MLYEFRSPLPYWHAFRSLGPRDCAGRIILNPLVVIVENDTKQLSELTTSLAAKGIEVLQCSSISDLERLIQENHIGVAVLDLDNGRVTNRVLREITRKCPSLKIIAVSGRSFHPELEEAMRSYLYACMSKPVDVENLMYLVESIFRDLPPT
jgi:DNA-binding NtrC family response regulator